MTRQGLLILDNSYYPRLVEPTAMRCLKGNMRVVWLEPVDSEVNLLEASATTPPSVEAALITAIRDFAGESPLLEWPFALGRASAQDAGRPASPLPPSVRARRRKPMSHPGATRQKESPIAQSVRNRSGRVPQSRRKLSP